MTVTGGPNVCPGSNVKETNPELGVNKEKSRRWGGIVDQKEIRGGGEEKGLDWRINSFVMA